jgi:3-deoxy-manno-octulosonate cytidylyltransferase (CMP-KDO synthetase)
MTDVSPSTPLGPDGNALRTVVVIPARYESTRFPGKPLIGIAGADGVARSLVDWSYRAASAVASPHRTLVATDDMRIAEVVRALGGEALMTPASCANGTERVAACLDQLPDADLLVNFQGDALLTPPQFVEALIAHMVSYPEAMVATVCVRCTPETYLHLAEDAAQGRVGGTTAVLDAAGNALYFSKRILPFLAPGMEPDENRPVLLHLGLYAYRRAALARYAAAGPTMLEMVEGLEQLRFLVHGIPVSVLVMPAPDFPMVEVNNPSDVAIVERILRDRA